MKSLRRYGAAIAIAASVASAAPADAATRAYGMRGLGGLLLSNSMDEVGARLSGHAIVQVGGWESWQAFAEDAAKHPHDRIVFYGHSMGAWGAAQAANWLKARGITAHVVGLDPLCTFPHVAKGVPAINYYSNSCGPPGVMVGARNIYVGSYFHVTIGSHVEIQNRMIASILGG